jgi:hypothetical protein
MLFLARGIEDGHYVVVEVWSETLVETPWRIEHEADGYRLSHADSLAETHRVFELGSFDTPESALLCLERSLA